MRALSPLRTALWVFLFVLGAAACRGGREASQQAEQAARPPNIIFVLADDLGYGDLGAYGQERIQTPHLDRLAAEGMRFTDFYAGATVCAPSRSVLMTGLHTGHTRVRGNAGSDIQRLRPEDVTVAEVLKAQGYTTALIGKWGLGDEGNTGLPTEQGFDEFFGYLNQVHAHNYYPEFLWRGKERVPLKNVVQRAPRPYGDFTGGVATHKEDYAPDLLAEEAFSFIRRNQARPFFLYLALTIPHANNEAGEEGMEVPDLGAYGGEDWPAPQKAMAAMVSRMDRDVGRLVALLQELGLDENTVVFFSSDNGPHAEGGNDPDFFDSNGPLRGIKRDLYEGGIRVPLIARWPGHVPAGTTSDYVGYFGDFMATAADLAGAPMTDRPDSLDSISFLPTLLGQPGRQQQHDYLYWEFYERGSAQAVRKGRWKGVRQPMHEGPVELYDLGVDVGEQHDVAAEHPELVREMEALMEAAHTPDSLWTVR